MLRRHVPSCPPTLRAEAGGNGSEEDEWEEASSSDDDDAQQPGECGQGRRVQGGM